MQILCHRQRWAAFDVAPMATNHLCRLQAALTQPAAYSWSWQLLADRLPCHAAPAAAPPAGGGTLRLLRTEEAPLVQRFDPSAELDTIGFFIAKFEKMESCFAPDGSSRSRFVPQPAAA